MVAREENGCWTLNEAKLRYLLFGRRSQVVADTAPSLQLQYSNLFRMGWWYGENSEGGWGVVMSTMGWS